MISIRNAREDEAAELAALGLRAWEMAMAPIGVTKALSDNARSAFENFTLSSWLSITVAEFDGEIVGWAAREHFDDKISDFWIEPEYQRKGVGSALLADVEREIIAQGFTSVRVESHAQNDQAIAFFRKHGYSVNWLTVTYAPKLDRDVQSIGLSKQLVEEPKDTYGPEF
ncbi:GNAT family N-acetyltransferase [Agrobacterium sp.]|uniref:GNAT family N-acetyltransferase n=1 Tax=Agrobacterium sp. TaxID=361 RepID=UPI0028AC95C9|nr:GNAT family N-acetyltransferase [Agrobacterium sp.]